MSHSLNCSMEISRMHSNFENWNDMRHEPRKFWLTETIFLIYAKLFHWQWGITDIPSPFFFFFLRKEAAVHGLFQAHEFF